MNYDFQNLSAYEYERLKMALPWITVLIAGADGHIDQAEINWAEKLTQIRSYSGSELLESYYMEVDGSFSEVLKSLIDECPEDTATRNELLYEELKSLNPILQKLHPRMGSSLYKDLLSFAKHIAQASGGVLRFFSISPEEKEVMGLEMIEPIHYDGDEDLLH
ncbi:MAG TPA: hypothetical protein PKC30_10465 [Saprospiraceae bacterium]|nr:hypothetical protein [Saprospiraceae bacterium]